MLAATAHEQFWEQLVPAGDLAHGEEVALTPKDLAAAWAAMPLTLDSPESQ